jgi:DNA-binding transcriptional MerR regulator
MDGCFIDIKNENKLILTKTHKMYSILDPDLEIKTILKSKDDIPTKLNKIEKIIKNYSIYDSTANILKKQLEKWEKIVNKKLKDKIKKIKKEIKIKSIGYA